MNNKVSKIESVRLTYKRISSCLYEIKSSCAIVHKLLNARFRQMFLNLIIMKAKIRLITIIMVLFSIFTSCINNEKVNLYPVSNEAGKYGYIDQTGKLIIDFKFEYAHNFYDNRALVLFDGKAYYINKKGKMLFEALLKPVKKLSSNDISSGLVDITYTKDYFIDIPTFYFFSEKYAVCYDTTCHAFGYIDTKGKVVISPKFAIANSFREGLASVKLQDTSNFKNNTFYSDILEFNNNKFGYINSNGNFEIEPIFFNASDFSQGKAFVNIKAKNSKTESGYSLNLDGYVINKKGSTLSTNISNTLAWEYSDGFFPAKDYIMSMLTGKSWYYIDSLYNHVPIFNDTIYYFNDITTFSDGIAGVRIDDFWRVIDTKMKILIDEKYSDVKVSSEGLIPVKKGMKWKFLSTNGTYPFNLEFDSCKRFHDGLAYVETYYVNSTIKGYINKKGEYVWQKLIQNSIVK